MTEGPANLPRLRRIRWGVRVVLMLGVAASVTANVLHARDNLISQVIAAWPPLALLLTVELISRVPVHRRSLAAARLAATVAIAGIAAWVSYWHMASVVARYGETGPTPYLMPFSVDGLVIVASVCLVELAGQIRTLEPGRAATVVPAAVPAEAPPAPPAEAAPADDTPPPAEPAEPTTVGTQDEAQPKLTPAAEKIARVRRRQPSLTQQDAARRAGVHINTVKTWWAYTAPAAPVTDQAPINGAVPESITT
jgi:hypothetical protein